MRRLLQTTEWVPDARTLLIVAPLALAAAAVLSAIVGPLRTRRGVAAPYTRKLFHFGIFSLAAIVQLVWGPPGVLVYGATVSLVVLYAVLRGSGYPPYEALARPGDAPHRTLFILVPLATTALGGLASTLLFERWAVIGYLVVGWGDAAGEPVGTRWGRHRYRVPSLRGVPAVRTVEGSLAVFLTGAAAAFGGCIAAGVSTGTACVVAMAAAAAGALVEAFSTHGMDNLTVQLAASGAAYLILA